MKKNAYITPDIQEVKIDNVQLLSGSGVTSDNGIDFGGIDQEGTIDPSAPELPELPEMPGMSDFVFK